MIENENYQLYKDIINGIISEEELFLLSLEENPVVELALRMMRNKKKYPSLLILPEEVLSVEKIYNVYLRGNHNVFKYNAIIEPNCEIKEINFIIDGDPKICFDIYSKSNVIISRIIFSRYQAQLTDKTEAECLYNEVLNKLKQIK